jgi:hypothetical protein
LLPADVAVSKRGIVNIKVLFGMLGDRNRECNDMGVLPPLDGTPPLLEPFLVVG